MIVTVAYNDQGLHCRQKAHIITCIYFFPLDV